MGVKEASGDLGESEREFGYAGEKNCEKA